MHKWIVVISRLGIVGVAFVTFACGHQQTAIRSGIAIEHVTVVDVVNARTLTDMAVVVDGTKVVAAQPSSIVVLGNSVVRVDGAGKYLIPGLWDMHVHALGPGSADESAGLLPLFIANGVTGIRDMWGDLSIAAKMRAAIDSGAQAGPRWVVAGNLVDAPHPWWPDATIAGDSQQGRRVVDSLAAAGSGFIKVYSLLDPPTYRAILARAREVGLPVAGHVPFSVSARDASALGQASFEHLFGVMEGCSRSEESIRRDRADWLAERAKRAGAHAPSSPPLVFHPPHNPFFDLSIYRRIRDSFDNAGCTSLLRVLAEHHTWQVPTLVVNRAYEQAWDDSLTSDPRQAYLPTTETADWLRLAKAARASPAADRALALDYLRKQFVVVSLMAKFGVPILAGTDSGNPFTFPGFSLHDELGLLVQAGLSPAQALQAATYEPALFLNATGSLGTIAPGKLADLVLLDGNPLQDISNTRRISAVVANGRLFRRSDLDRLLAKAREIASRAGQGHEVEDGK